MTLRINEKDHSFVLITEDDERAEKAGLTLSTRARGSNGENVYYTADKEKKPILNPYAVLEFFDEADEKTKNFLERYRNDYEKSWKNEEVETKHPAPEGLEYRPFQNAGISYGVERQNTLIGDEPGLGKSGQAIGICNVNRGKRNLIICPASIRLNWQKEIRKWSTMENFSTYPILQAKQGVNPYSSHVIVSYELARHDEIHAALMDHHWDNLIIDEAHYLKSINARRTQAVFGGGRYAEHYLAKKCGNIIALTGTPLPNRPRECYTLARALCWEAIDWASFDEFAYRYNPSALMQTKDGDFYTREEKGRLAELQARLRCNFMVRRLKSDVAKDLPDKTYEFAYIEPNGAIREALAKERLLNFTLEDLKDPHSPLFGMLSTIRREMGEAKVPRIVEHLKFLLDVVGLEKVVVFCHHRSVMDAVAHYMQNYGVVQVRGGMSPIAKQASIEKFVKDPNTRIFEGQMDAAGFGIDGLQGVCSHAVIAEPAWTPGTNEQAIDRIHRIGQHDNVMAQFLIVEGSLDERILASVLDKNETIHESLDRRF